MPRGDELPEHLQTAEGRRAALQEAKRKLQRERDQNGSPESEAAGEAEASGVKIGSMGRRSSPGRRAATDGCARLAVSSMSTAVARQSRFPARVPSAC